MAWPELNLERNHIWASSLAICASPGVTCLV